MLSRFYVPLVALLTIFRYLRISQGVFLFMGLVSLGTNTFWNRILMFFMQASKYPLEPYTMYMQPRRMHLFTAIQLGLFVLLYAVKAIKTIAIAFPLIIAGCIPIRLYLLPRIFTEKELVMIDSDEAAVKSWLEGHGEAGGSDETQKSPDGDELTSQHDAVFKPDNEVDIETGERMDLALPLPVDELETAERRRRARRKSRKKSMSCPTPHLMFADAPYTGPTSIQLAVVEEEEAASDTRSEDEDEALLRTSASPHVHHRRRRPGRVKAMSCPTHILYAEADRQIKSNYFFG